MFTEWMEDEMIGSDQVIVLGEIVLNLESPVQSPWENRNYCLHPVM